VLNKNVVFLTSTNLSCNPRCLKEVKLLASMGANITVVAFNFHNWTNESEKQINDSLPQINFHYVESTKIKLFQWVIATLVEKTASFFLPFFSSSLFINAMVTGKRSWLLLAWIRKMKVTPHLVIAHNPAAFYPAFFFAKKNNIPFAIDIEDFHPGEGNNKKLQQAVSGLMKDIMPLAYYNSFASQLIKAKTEKILSISMRRNDIVVNNLFAQQEFKSKPVEKNGTQKFVWFSQFIDYDRGLEKILPILDNFKCELTLTLIGNMRPLFFDNEIKKRNYIVCIDALPQQELNLLLSNFDVGLAIEDPAIDMNRDICLTNKIWAYFQAGLYIVASNTAAQIDFINQYSLHGVCIDLNLEGASHQISSVINNKKEIRNTTGQRLQAASLLNWENESAILKTIWEQALI
jgi:hypothetical protein